MDCPGLARTLSQKKGFNLVFWAPESPSILEPLGPRRCGPIGAAWDLPGIAVGGAGGGRPTFRGGGGGALGAGGGGGAGAAAGAVAGAGAGAGAGSGGGWESVLPGGGFRGGIADDLPSNVGPSAIEVSFSGFTDKLPTNEGGLVPLPAFTSLVAGFPRLYDICEEPEI